jgi:hypothetical protein
MAQRSWDDILRSAIDGEAPVADVLRALFDRSSGVAAVLEGTTLDFKVRLDPNDSASAGEIARDILAFSNTEGGLLVGGVDDTRRAVGHTSLDVRQFRQSLGPYLGTRVDYDYSEAGIAVGGREVRIIALLVPRSKASTPALLRKLIQQGGLLRKVKYLPGSLFYRSADQTVVEPPGEAADDRAQALGFSWAAPRTRSSFILKEDRPLLRLYDSINDRVFGRDSELAEMRSLFDDPRGRGISIAGLGGIGKTELAIRLVQALHDGRRFEHIYSASAKESVLGAGGVQHVDPAFRDLPSFLRDLASWLGLQPTDAGDEELAKQCLDELKRVGRVLLFVDNLETVNDRRVTEFLENRLPSNVWLVLTGRIHRVRSFVAARELQPLGKRAAAQLLRHEFKRQGLANLADLPIEQLEQQAERLYLHPLALRWFAWACKIRPDTWNERLNVELKDVESFCIAHTLSNLPDAACRVLGALLAMRDIVEATDATIAKVAELVGSDLEAALYELECAGLLAVAIRDDGTATYTPSALSEAPAAELSRRKGWERDFATNIRGLTRNVPVGEVLSPVLLDLLALSLWQVKGFTPRERQDLVDRIQRTLPKCPEGLRPKLLALRAESERHQGNSVTADDLYRSAAEGCLSSTDPRLERDKAPILVEAATMALSRGHTPAQAERAIRYLEPIQDGNWSTARVLGMLTEAASISGDLEKSKTFRGRAENYLKTHEKEMAPGQAAQMRAALSRAAERVDGRRR